MTKRAKEMKIKRGRIFPYIQYFSQIKTFTWIWENNEKKMEGKRLLLFFKYYKSKINVSLEK